MNDRYLFLIKDHPGKDIYPSGIYTSKVIGKRLSKENE